MSDSSFQGTLNAVHTHIFRHCKIKVTVKPFGVLTLSHEIIVNLTLLAFLV